jgi:hypothetical protein
MSPERMGGAAFWASGGTVESRRGPIASADAAALLAFLVSEAEVRSRCGDAAAARHCAEQALELGPALARAISWRRCGAAGG